MDRGANSYRRFLDGNDEGIVEIVGDYKDGLITFSIAHRWRVLKIWDSSI